MNKELENLERTLNYLIAKQIPEEELLNQMKILRKGLPMIKLDRPAIIDDGIRKTENENISDFISGYNVIREKGRVSQFVPASGAATRMFKKMIEIRRKFELSDYSLIDFDKDSSSEALAVKELFNNFTKYAFNANLYEKFGGELESILSTSDIKHLLDIILYRPGLDYSKKPKGAVCFHAYTTESRNPFEEHLIENIKYICTKNGFGKIHFTIPINFEEEFLEISNNLHCKFQKRNYDIEISYSFQKETTDTLALELSGEPFYNLDNLPLFRPAGHGALLENLNDLEGDIVFIKNIDNVVHEDHMETTVRSKMIIGGLLGKLQDECFDLLRRLEISDDIALIDKSFAFYKEELNGYLGDGVKKLSIKEKKNRIFDLLNRPIRVCGMVKNTGAPGGGPFWVEDENGEKSLQIVEQSQIDLEDNEQLKIFESSTHFNPVDLVCGLRNYKGEAFDLLQYRNNKTGFISIKSKDGKELKALELPGLWNGSMAFWNTVFVEVPLETFNPVKEVNDLLKQYHQPLGTVNE